jgi:hypothetical protein
MFIVITVATEGVGDVAGAVVDFAATAARAALSSIRSMEEIQKIEEFAQVFHF